MLNQLPERDCFFYEWYANWRIQGPGGVWERGPRTRPHYSSTGRVIFSKDRLRDLLIPTFPNFDFSEFDCKIVKERPPLSQPVDPGAFLCVHNSPFYKSRVSASYGILSNPWSNPWAKRPPIYRPKNPVF